MTENIIETENPEILEADAVVESEPKKYGVFNSDGFPTAFYSNEIHNVIPEDAVEVSEDVWMELVTSGGTKAFKNGEVIDYVHPEPTDEEKLEGIRQKRDELLVKSDWTQLSDSPLSDAKKLKYKTYRQELRDITALPVDEIVWPTEPK